MDEWVSLHDIFYERALSMILYGTYMMIVGCNEVEYGERLG